MSQFFFCKWFEIKFLTIINFLKKGVFTFISVNNNSANIQKSRLLLSFVYAYYTICLFYTIGQAFRNQQCCNGRGPYTEKPDHSTLCHGTTKR